MYLRGKIRSLDYSSCAGKSFRNFKSSIQPHDTKMAERERERAFPRPSRSAEMTLHASLVLPAAKCNLTLETSPTTPDKAKPAELLNQH